MSIDELQSSPLMVHLLDSLKQKKDIGQYGRLTFAMVARHFLDEDELLDCLKQDPTMDEGQAKALIKQVEGRDYNPPSRERIIAWQEEQDFPICPNPEDPDACNVYKELQFPEEVYSSIEEYREQKAEASS